METNRAVVTVGNFDGVHLGHQALIDAARRRADAEGARVAVFTFAEHPMSVLKPDRAPQPIMPPGERAGALLKAGADRIEWLTPLDQILKLDPVEFVDHLAQRVELVGWVEGPDFRFGRGRAGDIHTLRELGDARHFAVDVIEPVETPLVNNSVVAVHSSLVRWLLQMGRVADVARCLGRPFAVRGEVRRGEGRGRQIGFPTANLDTGDRLLPADGVYAGLATIEGHDHAVAISVGTKPTFAGEERAFEAYILDYEGDLYEKTLDVQVARWLREQYTFASVDTLVAQMHRDVQRVRHWRRTGVLKPKGIAAA